MRRVAIACFLVAGLLLAKAPARSYTLQLKGVAETATLKWPTNTITIALSASLSRPPANIKEGSDVVGAARRALAHWAAAANVQFVEASSNGQSISAAGTSTDRTSLITVAHTPENAAPFAGAGSEMSARTRVFYTESGSITEADITLNPAQAYSSDGTPGTYDLEATFTHEIGHLLGLEHSGEIGATMQPRQGKNGIYNLTSHATRTLSDDDRAGVRALYGARAGEDARGAVTGVITFVNGAAVVGAHVWAEEATTGRVCASSLTGASGAYRIEGLLPGNYRVMVEPLNGPVYISEVNSHSGALTRVALNQAQALRTHEIGLIGVAGGVATTINAQLSSEALTFNPTHIGVNGHLSTVAVPVRAGETHTIYVGGVRLRTEHLHRGGITITSPFMSIEPTSIVEQEFGIGLNVISFEVSVSAGAPAGDYSLRLQTETGEVAYLAGGITIEDEQGSEQDEEESVFVASAAVPSEKQEQLAAGSLAVARGQDFAEASLKATDADTERAGMQLPFELGTTKVNLTLSNGAIIQAPLTFVSRTRVGFQIPDEATAGTALVEVVQGRRVAARTAIAITRTQPALFTESGEERGTERVVDEATRLSASFTVQLLSSTSDDARQRVLLFGTGFRNASDRYAQLDGQTVTIESISAAEEFPGLDKIILLLPANVALGGRKEFVLTVDGKRSNLAQLTISP
jgi:uncharacterized protein (TIGR03437 family)